MKPPTTNELHEMLDKIMSGNDEDAKRAIVFLLTISVETDKSPKSGKLLRITNRRTL